MPRTSLVDFDVASRLKLRWSSVPDADAVTRNASAEPASLLSRTLPGVVLPRSVSADAPEHSSRKAVTAETASEASVRALPRDRRTAMWYLDVRARCVGDGRG